MKRNQQENSRRKTHFPLSHLKGFDVDDAIEVAIDFPFACRSEFDQSVHTGHFNEPADWPQTSYCDMPNDLPF